MLTPICLIGLDRFPWLKTVARNTVNNDLTAVGVLSTYALNKGWINERPMIKKSPYTVRVRYLERAEIKRYLLALRPPFHAQQLLLLSTGMRLGESLRLQMFDVGGSAPEMCLAIRDSKTASGVRSVFVPPWAASAVRSHIAHNELSGTDRLFRIKRRTIQAEHNRARDEAGIVEYTIHDHRHTAAVALARSGIPLPLLQKQLGHKHIEMTMKYAQFHPSYNDVAPHFAKMGEMLGLADVSKLPDDSSGDSLGDTSLIRAKWSEVSVGHNLLQ